MHDFFCRLFNRNCAEDNDRHYTPVIEYPEYPDDGMHSAHPIPEPNSVLLITAGALVVSYFIRNKQD